MGFRIIARYIALTMTILGALGLFQLTQPAGASAASLVGYLTLIAVGGVTLAALKNSEFRILAGVLNVLLLGIGLWFLLWNPDEAAAIIRRVLGSFCLVGGSLNAVAMFMPPVKPGDLPLCPLVIPAFIMLIMPYVGLPMSIVAIRRIKKSGGTLGGELAARIAMWLNVVVLAWILIGWLFILIKNG